MVRKVLLGCGAFSSLLYVAMNIVCARAWPGYSLKAQTISELAAIGAPSRPLWTVLEIVYDILVAAFGWGVWLSAGGRRALRAGYQAHLAKPVEPNDLVATIASFAGLMRDADRDPSR